MVCLQEVSTEKHSCTACSRRCVLIVLLSFNIYENRSISKAVETFLKDFSKISTSASQVQHVYKAFLRCMRAKKYVKCKVGMFYLEKYLLTGNYEHLFIDKKYSYKNQFVNNKTILYQWIKPEFIDICVHDEYIKEASFFCKLLNEVRTPTEKLYCIVEISKLIYKYEGEGLGQENFLPIFIFTFIHLKVQDVFYNLLYIKKYRPVPVTRCYDGCAHVNLGNMNAIKDCDCTERTPNCNVKEQSFYLTNFEAMVTFIERLEYSGLNVDKNIYNDFMAKHFVEIDTRSIVHEHPKKKLIGMIKKGLSTLVGLLHKDR